MAQDLGGSPPPAALQNMLVIYSSLDTRIFHDSLYIIPLLVSDQCFKRYNFLCQNSGKTAFLHLKVHENRGF